MVVVITGDLMIVIMVAVWCDGFWCCVVMVADMVMTMVTDVMVMMIMIIYVM